MRKSLYLIMLLFLIISFTQAKGKYRETVFPTESKLIYDACLSENGKVIICTDNNNLKAFSVDTVKLLGNFTGGHRDKVLCVAMSPDSTMLASGGSDSTVVIWDLSNHTSIQRITFATGKVTCIKFSPDNQFILFGCSNSPVYLYNIKDRKQVFEFTDQKLDVNSVAFSPDGNTIAIAGGDKIIRLYNTANFKLKSVLKGHTDWVRSISFYNHNQNLISCGDDKKIIQWNLSRSDYKITRTHYDWILSADTEKRIDKSNMYVFGTMNGYIRINYAFGYYTTKLNFPVSKVLLLVGKSGLIKVAVATLGSGLNIFSAANMQMSK